MKDSVLSMISGAQSAGWTDERVETLKKLWMEGLSASQIAGELGVSEMTIKMHRRQVMRKMQAGGVAQLVRLADQLGMSAPQPA